MGYRVDCSAYESGRCTPVDIARAAIRAIERSNESVPPLRAVVAFDRQSVMKMAEASAERWRTGSTLSLLDGVPVSIKDDFKTDFGYQCRIGNNFIPEICSLMENSNVVEKLCDAGAVIIGVTNMPEFGCSSIGTNLNTNYQTPCNPHNTEYFTGGSSSGAASSVAAGLCPVAIAGDGGGSGRVPASFCGLVSLKPTKGLVEETGSYPAMISPSCFSPITASVLDAAIVMDVLCNGNYFDPSNSEALSLKGLGQSSGLAALKVGVYWEWFEKADPENVAICKHALKQLQSLGVELKEIRIPEVEESRKALLVTILTELSSLLKVDLDKHFEDIGAEAKLAIALGLQFSGVEVINALKQHTRITAILNAIFDEVDLIATPTTGCAIPKITPDLYPYGKIDAQSTGAIEQYTTLASFAGIPAISIPVGFREESKIPVGLQLIAPMFQEKLLLQVAWEIESSGKFPLRKPAIWFDFDLLNEEN